MMGRPRLYSDEERLARKRKFGAEAMRRFRKANPARVVEMRRQDYEKKHPGARKNGLSEEEKLARLRTAHRAYYLKNKEKISELHRRRYAANKEAILARNKAWAAANPEAVRRLSLEGTNRRTARLRGATGSHTREEWMALVERCGNRCACCGLPKKLTRDHIVPLVAGGSDSIDNIQPLCRECNSSKRDRTIRYIEVRP